MKGRGERVQGALCALEIPGKCYSGASPQAEPMGKGFGVQF